MSGNDQDNDPCACGTKRHRSGRRDHAADCDWEQSETLAGADPARRRKTCHYSRSKSPCLEKLPIGAQGRSLHGYWRRFLVGDCLRSCDCMETKTSGPLNITKLSNHTTKPTATDRMIASVLATDP